MTRLIRCLLGMCVAAVVAESYQQFHSASRNDILSGLTWATLDLAHLGQRGPLASLDGLNLTLPDSYNTSLASRSPRTRRLTKRTSGGDVAIEIEFKYIVPLFTVYESDNVNFEFPMSHSIGLPTLLREGTEEAKGERRLWDETLDDMFTDLEGLISLLGVDGSGCVRKALCEVAAMPSIAPEGLVGEMLEIFVRHLTQEGKAGELDESDFVREESETRGEKEEAEKQEDDIEEQTRETDEREEKSEKQKERGKSKAGKERPKRRRPKMIDEYVAAGDHGRQKGDCRAAFPQCPLSLLHLNNLA